MARPAGGLRRTAYATSAVGATVLALLALLGVSVVLARRSPSSRTNVLAGQATVVTPVAANRELSTGRGHTPQAGQGAHQPTAARPATPTPGTEAAAPPSSLPVAAGGGPDSSTAVAGSGTPASGGDTPATTMSVRAAKPGDWRLRVESRAEGALLGDDTGDSQLRAGDPSADSDQRFDGGTGPAPGAFAGYTARTVTQGRYLREFELRGEHDRRFVAAIPVLDVPSTWRPGDHWAWKVTAEDGKTSVDGALAIVGREVVTMSDGKTQVETVHLDGSYTFSGDRSITLHRKVWFAPSLGVPVRIEERSSGTDASGRSAARETTIELIETEPGSRAVIPSSGANPQPDAPTPS